MAGIVDPRRLERGAPASHEDVLLSSRHMQMVRGYPVTCIHGTPPARVKAGGLLPLSRRRLERACRRSCYLSLLLAERQESRRMRQPLQRQEPGRRSFIAPRHGLLEHCQELFGRPAGAASSYACCGEAMVNVCPRGGRGGADKSLRNRRGNRRGPCRQRSPWPCGRRICGHGLGRNAPDALDLLAEPG